MHVIENPMAKKKPILISLSWDINFYAHEMLDAKSFMSRVHFADHIYRSWVAMQKELEQFLKSGKPEMIDEVSVDAIPINRSKGVRGGRPSPRSQPYVTVQTASATSIDNNSATKRCRKQRLFYLPKRNSCMVAKSSDF